MKNDELRRKLEDFDKVTKIQRSMTYDSSEHDREMRELKNRLENVFTNYYLCFVLTVKCCVIKGWPRRRKPIDRRLRTPKCAVKIELHCFKKRLRLLKCNLRKPGVKETRLGNSPKTCSKTY